ncbi:hypothetical protein [Planococcus chinensis]|uniref:Uncharacterized protein n=1 Tax=Planococcus chinensis TaxID=272917 RepID=A0ABW4QHW3_9BACL
MKKKEKKSKGWIWDVLEFVGNLAELIFLIPRTVFRFLKDL